MPQRHRCVPQSSFQGFITLKAQLPLPPEYPQKILTLGDRPKVKRLDLSLLQREVAEIIGVTEYFNHSWKTNGVKASEKTLEKDLTLIP